MVSKSIENLKQQIRFNKYKAKVTKSAEIIKEGGIILTLNTVGVAVMLQRGSC
jgi:Pyruvate/2-oxoacid:ferredoxin oxidoreductase gamma subunit